MLTGTSVSTAVASGIAATVWGYRPSLSAPEVMALVRQASVDLGQPADFCLGGLSCPLGPTDPLRSIRRVSLCSAVVTACGGGLERCPAPAALPMCPARPAYAAPLPNLTPAQWAAVDARVTYSSGASLNVPVEPLAVCRHAALRGSTWSYPDTVCPFRQYFSTPIRPWTNPQPESDPCPLCEATVVSSGSSFAASFTSARTLTLYLGIDSDYSSVAFTDPSVLLNNQYEIKLTGITSFTGGDELRVVDIPLDPAWPTIHSAALLMKGEEGGVPYSTHSELLVH
jgi:hypothetical protein